MRDTLRQGAVYLFLGSLLVVVLLTLALLLFLIAGQPPAPILVYLDGSLAVIALVACLVSVVLLSKSC